MSEVMRGPLQIWRGPFDVDGTLYVVSAEVLQSTDDGVTWKRVSADCDLIEVEAHPKGQR